MSDAFIADFVFGLREQHPLLFMHDRQLYARIQNILWYNDGPRIKWDIVYGDLPPALELYVDEVRRSFRMQYRFFKDRDMLTATWEEWTAICLGSLNQSPVRIMKVEGSQQDQPRPKNRCKIQFLEYDCKGPPVYAEETAVHTSTQETCAACRSVAPMQCASCHAERACRMRGGFW